MKIARELVALVSKPTVVRSRAFDLAIPLKVAASIGIALCPDHANSVRELVRDADRAMYAAKRESKDSVRLFDPEEMAVDPSTSGLGSARLDPDTGSSEG